MAIMSGGVGASVVPFLCPSGMHALLSPFYCHKFIDTDRVEFRPITDQLNHQLKQKSVQLVSLGLAAFCTALYTEHTISPPQYIIMLCSVQIYIISYINVLSLR